MERARLSPGFLQRPSFQRSSSAIGSSVSRPSPSRATALYVNHLSDPVEDAASGVILFIQRMQDDLKDCIHVIRYIFVPETKDFVTFRFKILDSFFVIFPLLQKLTAIQFDNEFGLDGTELRDVVADSMLSSELNSIQLASTPISP